VPADPGAAIVAIAPSYVDARTVWTGTSDGRIGLTRDTGTTWADVTPASAPRGAAVQALEASHFDPNAAYLALAGPGDDGQWAAYRTRDAGRTWVRTADGLTHAGRVHAIREDHLRRGLLFAATDTGVFLSFDDGERWQSLQINLPGGAVRDLIVREADLVAATGWAGVWLLHDFSALRQITPDVVRARAFVFRPSPAWRVRGAPSPSAGPVADGAVIYYLLGADAAGPVVMEIVDPVSGATVRRLPEAAVASRAGLHRAVWDLRHEDRGPWALPGTYQIHLTVAGQSYRQALTLRLDPRVRVSTAELVAQFALSKRVYDTSVRVNERLAAEPIAELADVHARLLALFDRLQSADARPTSALESAAEATIARAIALIGGAVRGAAPVPR
jgi:hypothetical protein